MTRLLFIDDDPQAQQTLRLVLEGECEVFPAYTGRQGIQRVREEDPDVVLLDIGLPDLDGLKVLEKIVSLPAAPPVIVLTAYADINLVVSAVKGGAFHYIVKPYGLKELRGTIRQALLSHRRFELLEGGGSTCEELSGLVGQSSAMRQVKELILKFGPTASPVLLLGESGTGKELAAGALHAVSGRQGPMVALNCAALPDNLVESELFGTERGAYTDAIDRAGAFERASGGSLFLDEIGDMAPASQGKLLRALEEMEVSRLGGSRSRPVDVRVIAASHRNLKEEPAFRQDLYYRLGVLLVCLPPLRERREDIPLLAVSFLEQCLGRGPRPGRSRSPGSTGGGSPDAGRPRTRIEGFTDQALDKLVSCEWPGNVRQLRNAVERAAILADGTRIGAKDIVVD